MQDVNRVAKQYLNPTGFAVLIVGNPQELGPSLKGLGVVKTLEIAIPPPPAAKPAGH